MSRDARVMCLLALAMCVCRTAASAQCNMDVECKGDRICVDGACVDPAEPPLDATESAPTAEEDPEWEPLGNWTFWVNPLGFVQFGPTLGVERRTVGNLYAGMHFRYAAMGAIYTAMETHGVDDEVWMGSAAVGVEAKYYAELSRSPHLFYYGLFGEYAWGGRNSKWVDQVYDPSTMSYTDETRGYEDRSTSLVLGGTLGWRWRFGADRKVLLSLGILCGVARELTEGRSYLSTTDNSWHDQYDDGDVGRLSSRFFGTLELGLGYGM